MRKTTVAVLAVLLMLSLGNGSCYHGSGAANPGLLERYRHQRSHPTLPGPSPWQPWNDIARAIRRTPYSTRRMLCPTRGRHLWWLERRRRLRQRARNKNRQKRVNVKALNTLSIGKCALIVIRCLIHKSGQEILIIIIQTVVGCLQNCVLKLQSLIWSLRSVLLTQQIVEGCLQCVLLTQQIVEGCL